MLDESVHEQPQREDPIDIRPSITKELWMNILKKPDLVTEEDIKLFKLILNCKNCEFNSSQLAPLLKKKYVRLNNQIGELGERIAKEYNIQVPIRASGKNKNTPMYWKVLFRGRKERKGRHCYILKPELKEVIQEIYEKAVSSEIISPEEVDAEIAENFYEGTRKQVYVNSYERNRDARDQCVKHYEARCIICGFDFEKTYGKIGRNVIHVHHLKPLSEIGERYQVDPINDLRPVCPNCHVIIHKKAPPYSIDEVMAMIKNAGFE